MYASLSPGFSVYRLVERVQKQEITTLLNHRQTMSLISYEIENASLVDATATRIFAGFQHLSKFLPQVARYERLAQIAESIFVFGVPDVEPPPIPNVHYLYLEDQMPLAREWFLISYSADYACALVTEEISQIDDPDPERIFKGLWTFNLGLVSILNDWLTGTVDARPLMITEDDHDPASQQTLLDRTRMRLLARLDRLDPAIRDEVRAIVATVEA